MPRRGKLASADTTTDSSTTLVSTHHHHHRHLARSSHLDRRQGSPGSKMEDRLADRA